MKKFLLTKRNEINMTARLLLVLMILLATAGMSYGQATGFQFRKTGAIREINSQQKKPVQLSVNEHGILISVSALNNVIPDNTQLKVRLLSDGEKQEYINKLKDYDGIKLNQSLAFDITLHNKLGEEIQPNGEVTVEFSGVGFT